MVIQFTPAWLAGALSRLHAFPPRSGSWKERKERIYIYLQFDRLKSSLNHFSKIVFDDGSRSEVYKVFSQMIVDLIFPKKKR